MKIRSKILILIIACAIFFSFTACNSGTGEAESGKIVVAVSIIPEKTFVEAVCGNLVEVVVMIPPGYSPESYEPTPQEMVKFSEADIYFSIGVPVEETFILPALSENTELIPLYAACDFLYGALTIDGGRDPHIWLSPKRAMLMVQAIADEMSALDPDNAKKYDQNAKSYIEKLQKADAEIRELLEGIKSRNFIVFHPAFGYFADEYDLMMHALEKNGKEATAKDLMEMTDFAKERGIKVIFYQAETDSGQSAAFAEEIGGRAVMLDPLSGDYIENLKSMAKAIAEGA